MTLEEVQATAVLFRDLGLAAGIFLVGAFLAYMLIRTYSASGQRNDEMLARSLEMTGKTLDAYQKNSEIIEKNSNVVGAASDALRNMADKFGERFDTLTSAQLATVTKVDAIQGTVIALPEIAAALRRQHDVENKQHSEVIDLLHTLQEDHKRMITFLELLVKRTEPTPPTEPDDNHKVVPLRTDADGAKHNAAVDAA